MEIWKDTPNNKHYQVSSLGNVRRKENNRLLKPELLVNGYLRITLSNADNSFRIRVHRLVMLAFVGEAPKGYEVNHINGCKNDNRLENLEYVTPSENLRHSYAMGRTRIKGRHFISEKYGKLSPKQVRVIKHLLNAELQTNEIAHFFGVKKEAIRRIQTGETWSYV